MMMTCRLLCALLVLALCCCPSVCVSDQSAAQPVPEGFSITTTTTTTQAPTTTTTSTTQAPSTTTTEAPAVSTTRAPSSLREMDGSLSSSAWVCAPLLLAASALAYTALG
ncbi:mucin TcMUCI, putative [Trypanosoma cruzi]|uniref:Mucin TcMUCI, putative n=1 Tax=Trypanosoma cruzi (strain CL Brener) TaxID=353153 RepID=Q4CZN5_TRYCC|nr:mucin TcMUCI, putative [Trypanosoma cruzi]EAN85736.1 mucin TcMUCI, putative [Trypanosoma cruzi]|eukprot:XP_807587.1 mucin TcMUCI [Trypanosoma cruzi strain CL Brener]